MSNIFFIRYVGRWAKRKVLCHHQPSVFQEDDLWVVRASPLSCHMMDGWDVTPCPGLFPLTAEGHVTACYFSPSIHNYSDLACITICEALQGPA